jgi:hypothetical protein
MFARSFPVLPNICHTMLAGMHKYEALTWQFLHAQVLEVGPHCLLPCEYHTVKF